MKRIGAPKRSRCARTFVEEQRDDVELGWGIRGKMRRWDQSKAEGLGYSIQKNPLDMLHVLTHVILSHQNTLR